MSQLTDDERMKLEILRRKSFRGGYLMPDEMEFLGSMFSKSPDEYQAIGEMVKREERENVCGWGSKQI